MKLKNYEEYEATKNLYYVIKVYTMCDFRKLPEKIQKMYTELCDECEVSIENGFDDDLKLPGLDV